MVPVRWATPDEERVLHRALASFEQWLAVPVCVDHVAIGVPVRGVGQYNRVTRGITLLRAPEPQWLGDVVRHELCHGIDLQNDVVDGREDLFPFPDEDLWTEGRLPREAFAEICRLGDRLDLVLGQTCPDDPDLRGARLVADEVFGLEPDPGVGARFVLAGTAAADADLDLILDLEEVSAYHASAGEDELAISTLDLPHGEIRRFVAPGRAPVDGPCPNETTELFVLDGEVGSAQIDGDVLSWGTWSFSEL